MNTNVYEVGGALLHPETIAALFPAGLPGLRLPSTRAVQYCLDVFLELGVNPDSFRLHSAEHAKLVDGEFSFGMPIESLVQLGAKLRILQGCAGFASLGFGFRNPTQFGSTAFEVDCAFMLSGETGDTSVEFSPTVKVNGREKHPDFMVKYLEDEIVCECKSLFSRNRTEHSRALKLAIAIQRTLEPLVPSHQKIEVAFRSLPTTWNSTRFIRDLCKDVRMLVTRDATDQAYISHAGKTVFLKLCNRDDPQYFAPALRAGNVPEHEHPTVVVCELRHMAIKDILSDALTQLPNKCPCIIFLYCLKDPKLELEIKRFFSRTCTSQVIAVVTCTDMVKFYINESADGAFRQAQVLVRQLADGPTILY